MYVIRNYTKKFASVLIVCQWWRYNEKNKTGITFNLDVILNCDFLKKIVLFEGVSVKKIKLHAFSEAHYCFKMIY